MKRLFITTITVLVLMLNVAVGYSYHANEYMRNVVVNGVLMSQNQLGILDQLNGAPVPNGRYWLDVNTGVWGYEGGPPQGILGQGGTERYRGSSSEEENPSFGFSSDGITCIGGDCSFNMSP